MPSSDFWWLDSRQKTKYMYAEFGHHRPIRDDEDPWSIQWDTKTCVINQLNDWRESFQNTNVYRSLKIATAPVDGEQLIGPFLVDIDNDNEDLDDALVVARKTFHFLQDRLGVDANNVRIFFTGHKGFNLEVHPQVFGIRGSIGDQSRNFADSLRQITEGLRVGKSWQTINQVSDTGTVIDQIYGNRYSGYRLKHPYIRLHSSLNKWLMSDGRAKIRTKIELSVDELNKVTAREVVDKSKKQAP